MSCPPDSNPWKTSVSRFARAAYRAARIPGRPGSYNYSIVDFLGQQKLSPRVFKCLPLYFSTSGFPGRPSVHIGRVRQYVCGDAGAHHRGDSSQPSTVEYVTAPYRGVVAFPAERRCFVLRRAILIGALALLVTVGSLTGCGATRAPRPLRSPGRRLPTKETGEQAKQTVARQEAAGEVKSSAETTTEEASGRLRCSEEEKKEREDLRLGDFEPPEYAPEYEIFEEQPVDRYGAENRPASRGHTGDEREGLRPHRPRHQV